MTAKKKAEKKRTEEELYEDYELEFLRNMLSNDKSH